MIAITGPCRCCIELWRWSEAADRGAEFRLDEAISVTARWKRMTVEGCREAARRSVRVPRQLLRCS